jgi:hypothetical protein
MNQVPESARLKTGNIHQENILEDWWLTFPVTSQGA